VTRPPASRGARPAWTALAVVLTAGVVVALVPASRPVVSPAGSVASVLLVLAGVALHRPVSRLWLAVAAALATWAAASVLQAAGVSGPLIPALVGGGQVITVGLTVMVSRMGVRATAARGSRVDVVIIGTVLGLVGAQLVAASMAGSASLSSLVVPTVDVTIIGMLLRFVVTRPRLHTSPYLALAAAMVSTVYDLACAVRGVRLAPAGDPLVVLDMVSVLLFGVAALHPSMVATFDPAQYARRRASSASLLGLLPLVVVPAALWVVSSVTGARGLPAWALLLGGAVVAGLCLLRGARALRDSEHLAEHDPLTELPNRRGLARAHDQEPPAAGRSMLLVDLDEFKQVNDTHGHDVGDGLLLAVRDRLVRAAEGAEVVARLGGDEFVILVASDRAGGTAERVLGALRSPVPVGALALRVSASIGIADGEPGTPLTELLTRTDVAMYAAKGAGRDTAVRFVPRMRDEVARHFALTGEVRLLLDGAAPADVGRLELHYQPLVELASGVVVGAEALVRWRHPEHGLLPPGDFLGAVSASGLDARLDSVVLLAALDQLRGWRERGLRVLPVSVNLTRDSLVDPRLADDVLTALADAGVRPELLHLEITEHQELPEEAPVARSLERLSAAGVGIQLDDYGVGYTSLDYLRRFPVETLKLDRSVVTGLTGSEGLLVPGVVAMAEVWGVQVLAEGVETPGQREELVRAGVRYGQGYLFSRPLPAGEFERLLAQEVDGDVAPLVPTQRGADPAATVPAVPAVP
jgi:diguanylate cyclase (GGDEF)-like protein